VSLAGSKDPKKSEIWKKFCKVSQDIGVENKEKPIKLHEKWSEVEI
jgi:hypothetical protein